MAIQEKLRGNFKVNIRKDLPEPLRVSQLANEPIAYFLHKKGDFLPRLNGKQPRVVLDAEKLRRNMLKVKKSIEDEERKEVYRMYMYNLSRNNLGLGPECPVSKSVNSASKPVIKRNYE
jgi:hypothetical protein